MINIYDSLTMFVDNRDVKTDDVARVSFILIGLLIVAICLLGMHN